VRVLIVDDSRAIQNIIKRGLEKVCCGDLETKFAGDGVQALDIARAWEPDLIISDWHMPNMSGLELLHALNREMLGIKLGLVTTETSQERLAEARAAGAKFIVNKPFHMETLIDAAMPALREKVDVTVYDQNEQEKLRLGDIDQFTRTINHSTEKEVFVERVEPIIPESIRPPFVLSFYVTSGDERVRAIGLLDIQAAIVLGAAAVNASEMEVHNLIAEQKLPQQYLAGCEKVMQSLGTCFWNANKNLPQDLKLSRINLVNKPFPKLKSLLITAAMDRIDMEIAVLGYGLGRIILVSS